MCLVTKLEIIIWVSLKFSVSATGMIERHLACAYSFRRVFWRGYQLEVDDCAVVETIVCFYSVFMISDLGLVWGGSNTLAQLPSTPANTFDNLVTL